MSTYQIVIHEYNDNNGVGHVNVEWRLDGVTYSWFGNNVLADPNASLGYNGGIVDETLSSQARIAANPGNHRASVLTVSESGWLATRGTATNMANATAQQGGNYDLVGGNCVDFADDMIAQAYGYPADTERVFIQSYMQLPSLARDYAIAKAYASELWGAFTTDTYYDQLTDMMFFALSVFPQASATWDCYDVLNDERCHMVYNSGWASPMVLDLNGDGINTLALEDSSVAFDVNGDGVVERTGWVRDDDGLLALDRNGNGLIDDGNELFGGDVGHGVTELTALDTNHDGLLSADDADFAALLVWQDTNLDGVSQSEELQSLAAHGIASIDLGFGQDEVRRNAGNVLFETSRASTTDGRSIEIADVYFRTAEAEAEAGAENLGAAALVDAMARFEPAMEVERTWDSVRPEYPQLAMHAVNEYRHALR